MKRFFCLYLFLTITFYSGTSFAKPKTKTPTPSTTPTLTVTPTETTTPTNTFTYTYSPSMTPTSTFTITPSFTAPLYSTFHQHLTASKDRRAMIFTGNYTTSHGIRARNFRQQALSDRSGISSSPHTRGVVRCQNRTLGRTLKTEYGYVRQCKSDPVDGRKMYHLPLVNNRDNLKVYHLAS